MDGWMDEWMDGRMDGYIGLILCPTICMATICIRPPAIFDYIWSYRPQDPLRAPRAPEACWLVVSPFLLYKYIYFQHKCICLFGYIYVVLPEGVIPLLNPLPGGPQPNYHENWREPCWLGFRAFALPSCGQSRTSKKRCKNSKNRGFGPLKTLPTSSQNAYLIEPPFNMHFVIDFSRFLVVFGFVRFFFEGLKT